MDKPFGEDLWRNVQAVRIERDGTFRAPVKANGEDGVVVGVDAVAAADARPRQRRSGWFARLWGRVRSQD